MILMVLGDLKQSNRTLGYEQILGFDDFIYSKLLKLSNGMLGCGDIWMRRSLGCEEF